MTLGHGMNNQKEEEEEETVTECRHDCYSC